MSRWTPCKRREFIRRLRALGFEGPYTGTRHYFMVFRQHRLAIPSNDEYSVPQLPVDAGGSRRYLGPLNQRRGVDAALIALPARGVSAASAHSFRVDLTGRAFGREDG